MCIFYIMKKKIVFIIFFIFICLICYFYASDILFLNVPKLKNSRANITRQWTKDGLDYIIETDATEEKFLSYIDELKQKGFYGKLTEYNENNAFLYSGLFKKSNRYIYVLLTKEYNELNHNLDIHISNYDQWL